MNAKARVVLVTGGNRGVGFEVCRQLADRGYSVILTARDFEKARIASDSLQADGLQVVPLQLDVTDPRSVLRASEVVERDFGYLDALVNNAGIDYDTDQNVLSADLDRVEKIFVTNALGPWRVVQAFIALLKRGRHGRIVNVTAGAGTTAHTHGAPGYSVSKAALNVMTRMLAVSLEDDSILVNAVTPGWVATKMGGSGGRPVADGAASIVWGVTLPDDGPNGGFFLDGSCVPW